MSMRVQDALGNCCDGIKQFASSAANWIGRTASAVGSFIAATAAKVTEFVRPYLKSLVEFAKDHKEPLIIATIALAIGAAITAVASRACNSAPATPVPAPTP